MNQLPTATQAHVHSFRTQNIRTFCVESEFSFQCLPAMTAATEAAAAAAAVAVLEIKREKGKKIRRKSFRNAKGRHLTNTKT